LRRRELEAAGAGRPGLQLLISQRRKGDEKMAALRIVGIALLVLGILSLAYQGITYTKSEKVLEVGPITATKETKKTIPLPPVLGGVALVGGLVLLVAGARR
jgi:hypothetical protein